MGRPSGQGNTENFAMRKLFKTLDNPFLLAAEGFIAGAFLFWATTSTSVEAAASKPSAQASAQVEGPSPL
jgi:hypothetical protein